jgi:hypothetical protein
VVLRTPKEFTAVFVGERVREQVVGDIRVSEWSAAGTDIFQAQCTARRFAITSVGSTTLYHDAGAASGAAARSLAAFAARLEERYRTRYRGDIKTKQVHLMEMPRYGDISSGNVTGLSSGSWLGVEKDSNAKRALAHELVHPFVDVGTPRTDKLYSLAVEGFPSYFHLPVLAELEGEDVYDTFLRWIERAYLANREKRKGPNPQASPLEKPLLQITADELGTYKDDIGLGDRALLFFNWIRGRIGKERFFDFARELLAHRPLDSTRFFEVVLRFIPGGEPDLKLWLETTEYPERLRVTVSRR